MAERNSPTLEDVARLAGVSTATVSRCFNTPDMVAVATRQRVMDIIEQLGYTPHFGGRALASNRSNTMGAVIPTMDNAIFARGIQAFQETLTEAGVTLLVASSGYDPEKEYRQIQALVAQGTDGLLLIGRSRPERTAEFLERRKIPYVVTWNFQPEAFCFQVGFDNRKAMREMARAVLDRGHRQIGMIAGNVLYNDRAQDRIDGVRDALEEAGLSARDLPVIQAPYGLVDGRQAFARLMTERPGLTAVICGNDVLAVGAVLEARQRGLDVPGDISITGFDDIDLAEVTEPSLTTVHVPHRRMGEAAARILLDLREGNRECQAIELETHLVPRGSLGPPRH